MPVVFPSCCIHGSVDTPSGGPLVSLNTICDGQKMCSGNAVVTKSNRSSPKHTGRRGRHERGKEYARESIAGNSTDTCTVRNTLMPTLETPVILKKAKAMSAQPSTTHTADNSDLCLLSQSTADASHDRRRPTTFSSKKLTNWSVCSPGSLVIHFCNSSAVSLKYPIEKENPSVSGNPSVGSTL